MTCKQVATFIKKSLEISPSLRLVQKRNRPAKFSFIATNNSILLAVKMSVKYFLLRIPVIPEKWQRKEKGKRQLQSVMLFQQTQKQVLRGKFPLTQKNFHWKEGDCTTVILMGIYWEFPVIGIKILLRIHQFFQLNSLLVNTLSFLEYADLEILTLSLFLIAQKEHMEAAIQYCSRKYILKNSRKTTRKRLLQNSFLQRCGIYSRGKAVLPHFIVEKISFCGKNLLR